MFPKETFNASKKIFKIINKEGKFLTTIIVIKFFFLKKFTYISLM